MMTAGRATAIARRPQTSPDNNIHRSRIGCRQHADRAESTLLLVILLRVSGTSARYFLAGERYERAWVQCARVRNRRGKLGTGGQSGETDAWLPCRGRSGVFLFGIRRDSSRDEAHACAARPTTTPDGASSISSSPSSTTIPPGSAALTSYYTPPGTSARSRCSLLPLSRILRQLCADNSDDDDVPISLERHCRLTVRLAKRWGRWTGKRRQKQTGKKEKSFVLIDSRVTHWYVNFPKYVN